MPLLGDRLVPETRCRSDRTGFLSIYLSSLSLRSLSVKWGNNYLSPRARTKVTRDMEIETAQAADLAFILRPPLQLLLCPGTVRGSGDKQPLASRNFIPTWRALKGKNPFRTPWWGGWGLW